MNLSYDYFNHLENVDVYVCNPDGSLSYPITTYNRKVTIRLNDLSEFTCDIYKIDSTILDIYDYIKTKRQLFVDGLGWFVIQEALEHDDGNVCYKSIKAESLQSEFKNKGIYSEERIYCLYDSDDPLDTYYDSDNVDGLPSVVGQLYRQLDVQVDLTQGMTPPSTPYDSWTIVYISNDLRFSRANSGPCRTLDEGTNTGYSFMMNMVQDAFSAIFIFDYQYRTIKIMTAAEVTTMSNVLVSFSNLMNSVEVRESADDLITVLNCNGENCDISLINPSGTKYICNFDYFKGGGNSYPWMSAALTDALNMWESFVDAQRADYAQDVLELKDLYQEQTKISERLQYFSLFLTDLKNARDKYIGANLNDDILDGVITCEILDVAQYPYSYYTGSNFYSTEFTYLTQLTCYKTATYDQTNKVFVLGGGSKTGTATDCFNDGYLYFYDDSTRKTYGKLTGKATVNVDTQTATYTCNGFERYGVYDLLVSTGSSNWIKVYESLVEEKNDEMSNITEGIDELNTEIKATNAACNLFKYIKGTYPSIASALLRELSAYWIEGDYTNSNIKVLDDTTMAEEIEYCQDLYDSGVRELAKISQPKLSFEITASDLAQNPDFKDQMSSLVIGHVIAVEKSETLWYYPALVEISFDLDHTGEMSLGFANSQKLDEFAYNFADLVSKAANTSKKVEANWGKFNSYSKDKQTITNIINDPLDLTYRAATANMKNQEFNIDDTGILGRKRSTTAGDIFDPEQVRLMNNVMIFTDDNWATIKTALGKISYSMGGTTHTAYGLAAEVVIGNLILGSSLNIQNNDSSVIIDAAGINIYNSNSQLVFQADTAGNVYLSGYVTSDMLQGYAKSKDGTSAFGYVITPSGCFMGPYNTTTQTVDNPVFACDANGIVINGYLSEQDAEATYAKQQDSTPSSFKYDLSKTGFTMQGYVNSQWVDWLVCDSNGLSVNCDGTFSGSLSAATGTFVGNLSAAKGTFGYNDPLNPEYDNCLFTIGASKIIEGQTYDTYAPVIYTTGGLNFAGMSNLGTIANNIIHIGGDGYSIAIRNNRNYVTSMRAGYTWNSGMPGSIPYATLIYNQGLRFYQASSSSINLATVADASQYKVAEMTIEDGRVNVSGDWGWQGTVYSTGNIDILSSSQGTSRTLTMSGDIVLDINGDATVSGSVTFNGAQTTFHAPTEFDSYVEFIGSVISCSNSQTTGDPVSLIGDLLVDHGGRILNENGTPEIVSDRRNKNTIESLDSFYDSLFDKLRPVSFKYNIDEKGRTNIGFIAQEVDEAIESSSLKDKNLAFVSTYKKSNEERFALSYNNFIALNTYEIQKLKKRIEELESQLKK